MLTKLNHLLKNIYIFYFIYKNEIINILLIILELINLSISIVPILDIEKSSIVLNVGNEIEIHSKSGFPQISLKKNRE